jgi:hypothetical protein
MENFLFEVGKANFKISITEREKFFKVTGETNGN